MTWIPFAYAYVRATTGPLFAAAAQFGVLVLILRELPPADFGVFSYLLVLVQLGQALWGALLCTPLPRLVSLNLETGREDSLGYLYHVCMLGAVAMAPIFAAGSYLAHADAGASTLFAVFGFFSLLRWFARAQAYAYGKTGRVWLCDVVYSSSLVILSCTAFLKSPSIHSAILSFASSTLISLLVFGRRYLVRQLSSVSLRKAMAYGRVWRSLSGWALLGVVTTEATANAHVYAVTTTRGAISFAPLAASTLLVRPINVAMNALGDYERAQIAKALLSSDSVSVRRLLTTFLKILIWCWLVNAVTAYAFFHFSPRQLFSESYDLRYIGVSAILWFVVTLVRILRTPPSIFLQAAGVFRPLALASLYSAVASVVFVFILLLTAGPVWSIAGVLVGEIIYGVNIYRAFRREINAIDTRNSVAKQGHMG